MSHFFLSLSIGSVSLSIGTPRSDDDEEIDDSVVQALLQNLGGSFDRAPDIEEQDESVVFAFGFR